MKREWLKEYRKKKGLYQRQIASLLGIDQSAFSHYEQGRKSPPVDMAKKIGKILDFDWTRFYDDEEE